VIIQNRKTADEIKDGQRDKQPEGKPHERTRLRKRIGKSGLASE